MEAAVRQESTATGQILVQEGYDLVGAALEVWHQLGNGFLEEVYQESLELELAARRIPFVSQSEIIIEYKGQPLRRRYKPDLVVCSAMIAELKVVKSLSNNEAAQLLNYLKCTGHRVGYLLNFGSDRGLEWKRFIL